MVAKLDVVSYGSNQLRKKMNHYPDLDLSKNSLLEPVVKGKGYKPRDQMASKKQVSKTVDPTQLRGKAKRESVALDSAQNY